MVYIPGCYLFGTYTPTTTIITHCIHITVMAFYNKRYSKSLRKYPYRRRYSSYQKSYVGRKRTSGVPLVKEIVSSEYSFDVKERKGYRYEMMTLPAGHSHYFLSGEMDCLDIGSYLLTWICRYQDHHYHCYKGVGGLCFPC